METGIHIKTYKLKKNINAEMYESEQIMTKYLHNDNDNENKLEGWINYQQRILNRTLYSGLIILIIALLFLWIPIKIIFKNKSTYSFDLFILFSIVIIFAVVFVIILTYRTTKIHVHNRMIKGLNQPPIEITNHINTRLIMNNVSYIEYSNDDANGFIFSEYSQSIVERNDYFQILFLPEFDVYISIISIHNDENSSILQVGPILNAHDKIIKNIIHMISI